MYKMKFFQYPQLEFFEKKSSRFIIVIIYIYIIYLSFASIDSR